MKYIALFLSYIILGSQAVAQSQDNPATLEFLPGWRMDDGRHVSALHIRLAPNWKTYWRVPGETGLPPQLSVQGVAAPEELWPVPEIIDDGSSIIYGYHDEVIIPLIFPDTASGIREISGKLAAGVCEYICIPAEFSFTATLDETTQRDPRIVAALYNGPKAVPRADAKCRITLDGNALSITATLSAPHSGSPEALIVESADHTLWITQGQPQRNGNSVSATATALPLLPGDALSLDRSNVRLTLISGNQGYEALGCVGG